MQITVCLYCFCKKKVCFCKTRGLYFWFVSCCSLKTGIFKKTKWVRFIFVFFQSLQNSNITLTLPLCFQLSCSQCSSYLQSGHKRSKGTGFYGDRMRYFIFRWKFLSQKEDEWNFEAVFVWNVPLLMPNKMRTMFWKENLCRLRLVYQEASFI